MENKENKTAAELAREERKERIEKASQAQAEKKEKQANQSAAKKKAKVIVPIVAIVLVIVLALCYFFGVPHRVFSAVTLADGTKVSVAEYEYYYMSMYNNTVNTAYEYEQYYGAYYGEGAGIMMTGFDYTKTPSQQEYTMTDTYPLNEEYGENPTWADYLEQSTIETCQAFAAFYKAATESDFELSKEGKEEINTYVEELRASAAENDYALDAYLRESYGRGMTESLFREILNKQMVVSEYLNGTQEQYLEDVTADDIQAAYDKNPNEYNVVSIRCFTLQSEAATNTEDTKYTDEELADLTKKDKTETIALMEKFYNAATAENFTALTAEYAPEEQKSYYEGSDSYSKLENAVYSDITGSFTEEIAEWIYDSDRKIGDKKMFTEENEDGTVYCDTILITALPSRDDTKQPVSVRHILFALEEDKTVTNDDGTTTTETVELRTKEEAKKLADDTLAKWVKDGAKEDAFIKLANELSDDPGSSDNGGLYEDISKSSSYVEPFLDWCFADGRKVGDYGIVETEYGYHIMYMSAISDEAEWQTTIRETLAVEAFNTYYDSIYDSDDYKATLSNFFANRVRNRIEDYAANVVANLTAETTTAASDTATTTSGTETTTAAKDTETTAADKETTAAK